MEVSKRCQDICQDRNLTYKILKIMRRFVQTCFELKKSVTLFERNDAEPDFRNIKALLVPSLQINYPKKYKYVRYFRFCFDLRRILISRLKNKATAEAANWTPKISRIFPETIKITKLTWTCLQPIFEPMSGQKIKKNISILIKKIKMSITFAKTDKRSRKKIIFKYH